MTIEQITYQKGKWNQYIGNIWCEVFTIANFPKKGTLIEIAPGSVNKIGEGLSQYEFEGKLYIIEPNPSALESITEKYQKQLTRTQIIPIQKTLKDAIKYLPKCDAIISNHPLDDMIIGESLNINSFNDLFNDHYNLSALEQTRKYWEILESNPKKLEKIKEKVLTDWNNTIQTIKPNITIISQYESYSFQSMNITQPDMHAIEVLNKIRQIYSNSDQSQILKNVNRITDYMHWLLIKK